MREKYTEFQNLYLAQNCRGKTTREITDEFNAHFGTSKSLCAISQWLRYHQLNKYIIKQEKFSEEQLSFIYLNRYMRSAELARIFNERFGTNKTPGSMADVRKSKGWTVRITSGRKQVRRIMLGKNMVRLDFYVWECVNGPVPTGYTVIHLDNNPDNNRIDNLRIAPVEIRYAFSAAGYHKLPGVLAPALYAQVMLRHAIKKRLER
ncbi:HNH endonuclease [Salmonella enterica]|uniref:HNH endonuclease n=1 Tax=Salmonella enteritidis TaxID=149539 RepID=A0A5V0DE65_SALEN|nr:HNH endonuclease [Salmonella enterica]EBG7972344.1 HNH endonuclease [Salmonella enterica subsp. enterica serovar Newport]EBS5856507.1 HNH endonuclease [Salmonella enterica subsp. enterica serovar Enteritidis]EAR6901681.1 HNH endonuclease [Salmonella enterica]EAR9441368.1 HNH endonuclease [Salmonella enterica]